MDEMKENQLPEEEVEGYTPRPAWQVWMARVGVVIVFLLFLLQCLNMMGAGL